MRYVQALNGVFQRHINGFEPTQWDADNYCYAVRLTDEQVEHYGVSKLKLVTPPYYDPTTQTRDEGNARLVDGLWTQNWIVTDLDDEAAIATSDTQWGIIRNERNRLLADSDWTQLPDAPVDAAAWATYRQDLRDVTDQADPFAILWPVSP
jgi:hypothetical protein